MSISQDIEASLDDAAVIRGVKLPLTQLVNRDFFRPEAVKELQERLYTAEPFPHLVLDGLFNADLLGLVWEEFGMTHWREVAGLRHRAMRSLDRPVLGPATQLYFYAIYSGWFTDWLSQLTGVDNLLTDPTLVDGGLHETTAGGSFDVHRDFQRHRKNGLQNEMVMLTYLNKDWQTEWGGQLELWTKERKVTEVFPEFGRTLLMIHGPKALHGHPDPLRTPEGQTRRSVAAYYYSSPESADHAYDTAAESIFLRAGRGERIRRNIRLMTPPAVYLGARALRDARRQSTGNG